MSESSAGVRYQESTFGVAICSRRSDSPSRLQFDVRDWYSGSTFGIDYKSQSSIGFECRSWVSASAFGVDVRNRHSELTFKVDVRSWNSESSIKVDSRCRNRVLKLTVEVGCQNRHSERPFEVNGTSWRHSTKRNKHSESTFEVSIQSRYSDSAIDIRKIRNQYSVSAFGINILDLIKSCCN